MEYEATRLGPSTVFSTNARATIGPRDRQRWLQSSGEERSDAHMYGNEVDHRAEYRTCTRKARVDTVRSSDSQIATIRAKEEHCGSDQTCRTDPPAQSTCHPHRPPCPTDSRKKSRSTCAIGEPPTHDEPARIGDRQSCGTQSHEWQEADVWCGEYDERSARRKHHEKDRMVEQRRRPQRRKAGRDGPKRDPEPMQSEPSSPGRERRQETAGCRGPRHRHELCRSGHRSTSRSADLAAQQRAAGRVVSCPRMFGCDNGTALYRLTGEVSKPPRRK